MKRLLDISLACLLTALFVAIFPLMWIAARLEGHSNVLYRQDRIGLGHKVFRILKFRTMGAGRRFPPTQVGFRFCRRLGLDELPQILLVFQKKMSFVGPRPLIREDLYRYCKTSDKSLVEAIQLRQSVLPGMTGLSQISIRMRTRMGDAYWYMLDRDLWYIENRTIWLDLLILGLTPLYLLTGGRIALPGWLLGCNWDDPRCLSNPGAFNKRTITGSPGGRPS